MDKRRVVITGLGILSCIGSSVDTYWDSLVHGKSGIGLITAFDTTGHDVKIGGQVKDFNAEEFVGKKDARKMDRFLHFAVAAAKLALENSGIEVNESNAEEIGVAIGSGIGGMITLENQHKILIERGPGKVSPFFIPMLISNMASGHVGLQYGLKGPNLSIVTACATGGHCIGEAAYIIKRGEANVMLAGGTEATLTPLAFAGFANMKATSTTNDDPARASRPFDLERNGFVMSEGAGVLVLEEYEHAKRRGAHIYAELKGFGMTADAHHITNPEPEGKGATRAMRIALANSEITEEDVDYINAHGTATPAGDKAETLAIKNVFGERAYKIPISSTKSVMGHGLGAAGALESIVCILALEKGIIPPTINLEHPDPDCDLDYVPNVAIKREINCALNNSFGFGGQNAVLVFKKWNGHQ